MIIMKMLLNKLDQIQFKYNYKNKPKINNRLQKNLLLIMYIMKIMIIYKYLIIKFRI